MAKTRGGTLMEMPLSCPCGWKAVGPSDYLDHHCDITDANDCFMRVLNELHYSPMGVQPHEAFYVVWLDREENLWRMFRPSDGARAFTDTERARAAARAASDNPKAKEVRVLRCAQEVVEILRNT
jgi:hypothetical protein